MHHPILREQRVLIILIGAITLIHLISSAATLFGSPPLFLSFKVVPVSLLASFGSIPHLPALAELATSITYAFLHADLSHLVFNMLFLWIFGAVIVELIGAKWMLAIFFITAVAGAFGHSGFNPTSSIPMLGASGAVSGFKGIYLALAVRWRLPNPHIWPIASPIPPLNLGAIAIIGFMTDFGGIMNHENAIAYGAHLGGFLAGMILGSFVLPKPKQAQKR